MGQTLGPFCTLHIRRTAGGEAINLHVRRPLADELGWSAAFPDAWRARMADPDWSGRRPIGGRHTTPEVGGKHSGVWLASKPLGRGRFQKHCFRACGNWTRADLDRLREATIPEIHAISAGHLRWCRLQNPSPTARSQS